MNIEINNFKLHLNAKTKEGKAFQIDTMLANFSNDYIELKHSIQENEDYIKISVYLNFKTPCLIFSNSLSFFYPIIKDAKIGCNGYQSWTESKEFNTNDKIKPLRKIAFNFLKPYGDYSFTKYSGMKGNIHAWTFAYINQVENPLFIGSLNDKNAFTKISFQCSKNEIEFEKDINNIVLSEPVELYSFVLIKKQSEQAFKTYNSLLNFTKKKDLQVKGYTSWYLHYTKINPKLLLHNLEQYAKYNIHYFQIDDGWQNAVGDWLCENKNFKDEMPLLSEKIHQKNIKAGLWLAPLICEKNSFIYKNKKHWLLKDEKGKLVKAGYNPMWSGFFYALNLEEAEVKAYLKKVFDTIINKWNFDLLKLDFLYAAAIIHANGKTRGQNMFDAIQFLKSISKGAEILACGVPLASAAGLVDYCRIGADIHLSWEHNFLAFLRNRERVSTILSLQNTIFRAPLSQYWFYNDPDVIILRDNKNALSENEKQTIAIVNYIVGDVIFSSDDISLYKNKEIEILKTIYSLPKPIVDSILNHDNLFEINGTIKEVSFQCYINLNTIAKPIHIKYDYSIFGNSINNIIQAKSALLYIKNKL